RPAFLGELLLGPAGRHADPLARPGGAGRRGDAPHRLRDRTGADPVDPWRVQQGGPHGVRVGIDEARVDGLGAQADVRGGWPRQAATILAARTASASATVERSSSVMIVPLISAVSGDCAATGRTNATKANIAARHKPGIARCADRFFIVSSPDHL